MSSSDHLQRLLHGAQSARRDGRSGNAWREYEELVAVSRELGSTQMLLAGLKGLGQIERDRGNPESAIPYYLEATNLARDVGDELEVAHTIRHLADTYQKTGELDTAEKCYSEVLAIYRGNSRTRTLDLANAIRPMALLNEKFLRIDEARVLWEEAEQLYRSVAIDDGVEECRMALKRCS